ncbi:flagellar type III secretion system protein FlhB [Rhodovulum sp. DZ06]|uniref:flagellar type III secretion system protein FlhB n=1 Tax=Rhodovulum sp. DZ06 TaxID=3425126 RepID=UPI003D324FB2
MSQGGQDEAAEKSHEPTPQKLQEARRKGDVAKSADLGAAAAYLGMLAAVYGMGEDAIRGLAEGLTIFLSGPDLLEGRIIGQGGAGLSASIIGKALAPLTPLFLIPALAVIAAYVAQNAVAPSLTKIEPKLNRLSLIANAKNKFGPTGLVEFLKTFIKMTAVTIALSIYLSAESDHFAGMFAAPARAVPGEIMKIGAGLLAVICVIAAAVGAGDAVWQNFNHRRKLRMSDQEMKDEIKKSEGDPYMKGERQRRGREIATNRMIAEVPNADVVIVNPEHYAVALKWSRDRKRAPICIAKGVDEVAARIREAAIEAGVPIHRDPPCARALHADVEVGEEIRPDHYAAVAAAIRFADAIRAKARSKGW